MISGLDHVVIGVRDLSAASAGYQTLLGCAPARRDERDGVAHALFQTGNLGVELLAPVGDSARARRLHAALANGEGLKSLVFRSTALEADHRRLERVGLAPEPIEPGESGASFRIDTTRSHGVRLFVVAQSEAPAAQMSDGGVIGIDHIVIRTPQAERAAALYGARLGLDMRLDREVAGRRLMFFRCGDAIVEIAEDRSLADDADLLWGLSWRVSDADAEQARLAARGVAVSEVRPGFKPGTRVFTVRDSTAGVPTLMIEQSAHSRAG